jgi:hypothetical protein
VGFSPSLETASVKYVNFKMWYKTIDKNFGSPCSSVWVIGKNIELLSIHWWRHFNVDLSHFVWGTLKAIHLHCVCFFSNQYSYITLGVSAGIANHWVYEGICDIHSLKCVIGRHKLTSKVMNKNQLLPIAGLCLRLKSLGVDSWFYGVRLPLLY